MNHGSHNVSRWMTWLPISLKNAAKCDKWYQLQNHSITESLNANGAREKLIQVIPVHAVLLSVEQKPKTSLESWFDNVMLLSDNFTSESTEWLSTYLIHPEFYGQSQTKQHNKRN